MDLNPTHYNRGDRAGNKSKGKGKGKGDGPRTRNFAADQDGPSTKTDHAPLQDRVTYLETLLKSNNIIPEPVLTVPEDIKALEDQKLSLQKMGIECPQLDERIAKAKADSHTKSRDLKVVSGRLNAAENKSKQLADHHAALEEKLEASSKALQEAIDEVATLQSERDSIIKEQLGYVKPKATELVLEEAPSVPRDMDQSSADQWAALQAQRQSLLDNFALAHKTIIEGLAQVSTVVQLQREAGYQGPPAPQQETALLPSAPAVGDKRPAPGPPDDPALEASAASTENCDQYSSLQGAADGTSSMEQDEGTNEPFCDVFNDGEAQALELEDERPSDPAQLMEWTLIQARKKRADTKAAKGTKFQPY